MRIKDNSDVLLEFFQEVYNGIQMDTIESEENVKMYKKAIVEETGGKEMYGSSYNDALKIKGQVRDRGIKLLTLLKDRVQNREIQDLNKPAAGFNNFMTPELMAKMADDLELNKPSDDFPSPKIKTKSSE